ncbi:MAG: BrnT family toxin [Acidobacteriota bacterium]
MKFEWDFNKAALNIKNHGISFDDAKEAFFDDFGLDVYDDSHSDFTERRFQLLGLTVKDVLLVVYTVRYEEIYRIISARKATKYEEKSYWKERKKYE